MPIKPSLSKVLGGKWNMKHFLTISDQKSTISVWSGGSQPFPFSLLISDPLFTSSFFIYFNLFVAPKDPKQIVGQCGLGCFVTNDWYIYFCFNIFSNSWMSKRSSKSLFNHNKNYTPIVLQLHCQSQHKKLGYNRKRWPWACIVNTCFQRYYSSNSVLLQPDSQ